MLPTHSQVGSTAVKCYPNILPPLSALALPPIISLLFSELLLRLQLLVVIDGTACKGTRGHGSDGGEAEEAVAGLLQWSTKWRCMSMGTDTKVAVAVPSCAGSSASR